MIHLEITGTNETEIIHDGHTTLQYQIHKHNIQFGILLLSSILNQLIMKL